MNVFGGVDSKSDNYFFRPALGNPDNPVLGDKNGLQNLFRQVKKL